MTLHWPNGSLAAGRLAVDLDQERAGWSWTSLRVLSLGPGESQEIETGQDELLVLPLAGSASVSCAGQEFVLTGRASVFAGVTDFAYVPRDVTAHVTASAGGGRFALPGARADRDLPFRYGPAGGVAVELRGAGQCSRQVNNFCTETAFEADRLLACEVITPAGNWSSYPPHKHDEDRPGESVLEEIYYFELLGSGRCGTDRLPPGLRHPGPPCRRARRGPLGRRRARPARLARAGDGRARLRHVLPERDGRPGRATLADLRRPCARLGQGHLGERAGRPQAAVLWFGGAVMRAPSGERRS